MRFPYRCPPINASNNTNTHRACADYFGLQHQPPLYVENSKNDGDCFFHSLVNYGEAMNFAPLLKSKKAIRFEMIDYLMDNYEELSLYIPILNNGNNSRSNDDKRLEKIEEMRKPRVWFSDIGDIFPQILSRLYNLNVIIYNIIDEVNYTQKGQYGSMTQVVQRIKSEERPDGPTIYLLRTHDNHYDLFLPVESSSSASSASSASASASASASSSHVQKSIKKVKNNVNQLSNAIHQMKMENNVNKIFNLKTKKKVVRSSKAAALSPRKKSVSPPKNKTVRRSSRLVQANASQKKSSSPIRRTVTKSKKNKVTKNDFMSEIEGLFQMNMNNVEMQYVKQNLMNRILSSSLSDEEKAELISILT